MAEYNDVSVLFPKTKIGTKDVLDVWNAYSITDEFINNSVAFTTYLVEESDTWSSIAHKVYGDRRLWWVIAMYNNIEDPFQLSYDNGVPEKIQEVRLLNERYIFDLLREIEDRLDVVDFNTLDE